MKFFVSMYEAKMAMFTLGLKYVKILACPNDFILYRKEYEELSECPNYCFSRCEKK